MPIDNSDKPMNKELILAELSTMRTEIQNRSSAQHTLITLNITATGILAGLAFGQPHDLRILLLLPIISPLIGLLYMSHASTISELGRTVKTYYTDAHIHSFEHVSVTLTRTFIYFAGFLVPTGLLFMLFPAIALWLTVPKQSFSVEGGLWLLWWLGLLLTLIFFVSWILVLFPIVFRQSNK